MLINPETAPLLGNPASLVMRPSASGTSGLITATPTLTTRENEYDLSASSLPPSGGTTNMNDRGGVSIHRTTTPNSAGVTIQRDPIYSAGVNIQHDSDYAGVNVQHNPIYEAAGVNIQHNPDSTGVNVQCDQDHHDDTTAPRPTEDDRTTAPDQDPSAMQRPVLSLTVQDLIENYDPEHMTALLKICLVMTGNSALLTHLNDQETRETATLENPSRRATTAATSRRTTTANPNSLRKCFGCGEFGHMKRSCRTTGSQQRGHHCRDCGSGRHITIDCNIPMASQRPRTINSRRNREQRAQSDRDRWRRQQERQHLRDTEARRRGHRQAAHQEQLYNRNTGHRIDMRATQRRINSDKQIEDDLALANELMAREENERLDLLERQLESRRKKATTRAPPGLPTPPTTSDMDQEQHLATQRQLTGWLFSDEETDISDYGTPDDILAVFTRYEESYPDICEPRDYGLEALVGRIKATERLL